MDKLSISTTTILNITAAFYSVPAFSLYEVENGQIIIHYRFLKRYLEIVQMYAKLHVSVRIAENGIRGEWTDEGYKDGVLGLLQSGEAHIVPQQINLEMPDLPGIPLPGFRDDKFYAASLVVRHSSIDRDTLTRLWSFMSISAWTVFFLLLITINWMHYAVNAFPFFNSSNEISNVSKGRWLLGVKGVLYLLIGSCFGSVFSTQAVIGASDEIINSLEDVVKYRRAPRFVQGESMFELFRDAGSDVFGQVYRLAVEKGTSEPQDISIENALNFIDEKNVLLISERSLLIFGPLASHFYHDSDIKDRTHISVKPYYKGVSSFLFSPEFLEKNAGKEIRRRLENLHLRITENGIYNNYLSSWNWDMLKLCDLFPVTLDDLNAFNHLRQSIHSVVLPIKYDDLRDLFHIFGGLCFCVSILFLLGSQKIGQTVFHVLSTYMRL